MKQDDELKRRYKKAFSEIHIPQSVEMDYGMERKNSMTNWIQKHAIAFGAALVLLGSGTAAYAADLGGIRTNVQMWINGEQKEVEAVPNGDGGYEFYEPGSDTPFAGGGGVEYDQFGNEHPLSAQDVAENMGPNLENRDGRFYLIEKDREWDITDYLNDDGEAYLKAEGLYYCITVEDGEAYSLSSQPNPESGRKYESLD